MPAPHGLPVMDFRVAVADCRGMDTTIAAARHVEGVPNDRNGGDRAYRVGLLLLDGFPLVPFSLASEAMRAANALAGRALYHVRHVPALGAEARSASGVVVPADAQVGESADYDLILVVADGGPSPAETRSLTPWLRALSRRGVRLGGIAGGQLLLAEGGLLAGRRMAVGPAGPRHDPTFGADVEPVDTPFIVEADRVGCTGGAAALDMMAAILAEQHDASLADQVRSAMTGDPSGGRNGLAELAGATDASSLHPGLRAAVATMEAALTEPVDLDTLARRAGLGPRQLNRLFHARYGVSAMAHYRAIRVARASRLLERTGMSVTEVAVATGFHNFSHFSSVFRRETGLSPRAFRKQSRANVSTAQMSRLATFSALS